MRFLTFLDGTIFSTLVAQTALMLLRTAFIALIAIAAISCDKKSSDPTPDPDPPGPPDTAAVELGDKVLVQNLNFPWDIFWGPDDMIWMSEKFGKISRINPGTGEVTPLITIEEVKSTGEGGLLGMLYHAGFLYVAYDYDKNGSYTGKIVKYAYSNNALTNPVTIIDNLNAAGIHNGCRLAMSQDQKLFITTGDASDQANPQNPESRNGKILRLNPDGSVPADNPDPNSPVWSLGHRNPQGLVFVDDILFSSEHGPDSDDEVNIIEKGRNYGWPDVRGFCNEAGEQTFCNDHDVVEPLKAWTPTIAVCGIDYYNSDSIPQWKNSILMCTLKNERLMQLKLSEDKRSIADTKEFLTSEYGRMRDVCVAPDGRIFICTSNGENSDVLIEVRRK